MAKFDGRATFYAGNRCFRTHAMVLERVLSEEACLCTDCKQRDTESELKRFNLRGGFVFGKPTKFIR